MTLTLAAAVTAGQTVTVSYTKGASPIRDAAGNDAGNLSNQAVTMTDTTGPSPTFSPLNSATVTDAGWNITLTFGEAVKKDSSNADFANADLFSILTLRQTNSSGTTIGYSATIDAAKKVITINPTSDLPEGAVYVAISSAYYDAAGNQGTAASATFTVALAAPTDLDVKAGDTKLGLSWAAPTGTVSGYDVHYTNAPSTGDDAVAHDAAV